MFLRSDTPQSKEYVKPTLALAMTDDYATGEVKFAVLDLFGFAER